MTINPQWVMLNDEREIQNFDQFVQNDSLITALNDSAVLQDLLIREALAQALRLSLSGLRIFTRARTQRARARLLVP